MSHEILIDVACPRVLAGGELCDAEIECVAEWERGAMYGVDADGCRVEWRPGYYFVTDVPGACPEGHVLTDAEWSQVRDRAEEKAAADSDDDGW